jgi:hypothetical protein
MNIDVDWDDDSQKIIRYTFHPGWTLTEFHQVYDSVADMIRQAPGRVYGVIVDDTMNAPTPSGAIRAFSRTVQEGKLPLAIVGMNHVARVLMKVVEGTYHGERQIYYAKTLDEARAALRHGAEK